jgi:hypothetical protein
MLKKDKEIPLGKVSADKKNEQTANFTYAGNKKRHP